MAPDFTGLTKAVNVNRTCAGPLNELAHSALVQSTWSSNRSNRSRPIHQDVKGTAEGGIMVMLAGR